MPNSKFVVSLLRCIALVPAVLMLVLPFSGPLLAQPENFGKPSRQLQRVGQIVALLMEREHLLQRSLDDEVSQRAFDIYVKQLDPLKMYFLKSDIDEFRAKYVNRLDDDLKEGDYTAAFEIFSRYIERMTAQVSVANELTGMEHDYTIKEEMLSDPDAIEWAASQEELNETWRKRIKYNLLVFSNDSDEENPDNKDPRERLRNRYRANLNRWKQFRNEDVAEVFITSITSAFDPHTSYMSQTTYVNFNIAMSLELEGIGATLQSTDDGLTQIKRIVPGGAADKSGELKVNDKIVAVGQGHDGEMVDILDMKLDDVVKQIRGKAGTVVRLGVMRAEELRTVSILRERVELTDEEARGVVWEAGERPGGGAYKIGFIDLPSFYSDMSGRSAGSVGFKSTTADVRRILDDFTAKGVDAVILDLRRNGGGSLPEAIECSGLFIDSGPVVQTKLPDGRVKVDSDPNPGLAWKGPLVVLTSRFSASASEILAGAVQDYQRGLVVGDSSTHGKGTVQTLVNLAEYLMQVREAPPTLGALKITISQFYRPNGDSTQKRGVMSDIVLPSITDYLKDINEADLDYAIEFDHVSKARYTPLGLVSPELIGELTTRSKQRITESEKFQLDINRINKYVEQRDEKTLSLNQDDFLKRKKDLDSEEEVEKLLEDQANHTNLEIHRGFFEEEVIAITLDYIRMLGDKPLALNDR